MDNAEAKAILRDQLQLWRRRSYVELQAEVGNSRCFEVRGQSGTEYQVEIVVFWDDEPNGAIRVIGSIDDGGWRAFRPLTEDFLIAPE